MSHIPGIFEILGGTTGIFCLIILFVFILRTGSKEEIDF